MRLVAVVVAAAEMKEALSFRTVLVLYDVSSL